jgi:hypothetical protein
MRSIKYIIAVSSLLLITGCITPFVPETDETEELLVVQGLITDQPGPNTVKLSKSQPLGNMNTEKPLTGCSVYVEDDLGHRYTLHESEPGTYMTDPDIFCGEIGRKYTLRISEKDSTGNIISYLSLPEEMRPVPPVDSVYYEKEIIQPTDNYGSIKEGCQIYLNTNDKDGICKYYRWDYSETWEFRLPYEVPNQICWKTQNADVINIKNTAVLSENIINRYPIIFVSAETDRLSEKYSLLINQYSLSEEEYNYWEKLQNVSEEVGSLYDIIPASIPGNVYCLQKPGEKVLGYFSVSAKTSKRIFIKDTFKGLPDLYYGCPADTVPLDAEIAGLNEYVWVIVTRGPECPLPWYKILTFYPWCADCSYRGSPIKPDFWDEE